MKNKTVVVGLSGGVDSAVAAYLLKQQGYNVIAVFMQNWDSMVNFETNFIDKNNKCSAQLDYDDAVKVANKLEIPIYRKDFIKEYWDNVFQDFIEKYRNNLTPNPDIFCNKYIKFNAFLNYAKKEFNCDYIATGHYANVEHYKNQGFLKKAFDFKKDQTYFLCQLTNNQLSQTLFPLANLSKQEVREIAKKINIDVYNKKDSVGICFIGKRNLVDFLSNYLPIIEGNIIDITNNNVIGKHKGSYFYTIGQRKGLNIGGQKEKYFICKKSNNILFAAPNSLEDKYLVYSSCILDNFNWIKPHDNTKKIFARFRHGQDLQEVEIKILEDKKIKINFQKQKNIVSGQFCVLYQDEYCLGGGEIISVFNI